MAELGKAMKAAGQELSEDELKEMIQAVDRSGMYYPGVGLGLKYHFGPIAQLVFFRARVGINCKSGPEED